MLKVSIIVPVYNVAKYIERCIKSVLSQENASCDIECVIVNDCTPDNSISIIRDTLADYHGKIKFVFCSHDVNKGLSVARNTGIRKASGDYIFFMDSDDYITNDCLKLMIDALNVYPDVDVILGGVFSCKYNRPFYPPVSEPTLMCDKSQILLKVFFAELHCHAWNRLLRRDLILDNNLFFPEGLMYEDMPWTYSLYIKMSSMVVLPNLTYVYENNDNSIMNTTSKKANLVVSSFCYVINYILDNVYQTIRSDCRIYCFGVLLRTIEITTRVSCSKEVLRGLSLVKKRLVKEAILSGRIMMTLFFMTSFDPFVNIYKISFVRHNYHKITVAFSKLERRLDHIFYKAS